MTQARLEKFDPFILIEPELRYLPKIDENEKEEKRILQALAWCEQPLEFNSAELNEAMLDKIARLINVATLFRSANCTLLSALFAYNLKMNKVELSARNTSPLFFPLEINTVYRLILGKCQGDMSIEKNSGDTVSMLTQAILNNYLKTKERVYIIGINRIIFGITFLGHKFNAVVLGTDTNQEIRVVYVDVWEKSKHVYSANELAERYGKIKYELESCGSIKKISPHECMVYLNILKNIFKDMLYTFKHERLNENLYEKLYSVYRYIANSHIMNLHDEEAIVGYGVNEIYYIIRQLPEKNKCRIDILDSLDYFFPAALSKAIKIFQTLPLHNFIFRHTAFNFHLFLNPIEKMRIVAVKKAIHFLQDKEIIFTAEESLFLQHASNSLKIYLDELDPQVLSQLNKKLMSPADKPNYSEDSRNHAQLM